MNNQLQYLIHLENERRRKAERAALLADFFSGATLYVMGIVSGIAVAYLCGVPA